MNALSGAQGPGQQDCEIDSLRRTTRDLVAMSTLPAIWGELGLEGIVKSLSSVLLSTLDLDMAYVRLSGGGDLAGIDAIHSKPQAACAQFLPAARGALEKLGAPIIANEPSTIAHPGGGQPLRVSVARFGIGQDIGALVVASSRPDFPAERERLLLGVAANQAAVVLQRRLAEQALVHSESRFLDLADAAPAMLWVTEPDGSCSFLSRGWHEFTGQGKEEGLGFGWINAIHPEDRPAARQAFLDANEYKKEFSLEHRVLHVDGSYRWVIDTGRPRFSAAGDFLGFVGNVLDISDRKQTEQALRQSEATQRALFDEVTKSNRNLSQFLAVLAHELRNPLAPIVTGLEVMRMRADSGETVTSVRGIIERQVRQLSHLIDDLLDIARVTNGKVDIKKQSVDLKSIVSDAVETSLPLIEKGHHAFSLSLPDAPLPVSADPARIAQVIGNLLTNAAKYTPRGGSIALAVGQEGGEAVISVIDSGVGIPGESLESVFDMFSQVGRNMQHSQGGLGIGLALVRQLVSLHGGSVAASSGGTGQGSTFVVRLPLELADSVHPGAGAQAGGTAPQPGRTFRILVADDNVDAAMTLASMLEIHGHELRVAHDGQEALRMAGEFQPEVSFLDIGMPDMTGYEVARRIRQVAGLERSVIAAVSGWGAEDDLARAREAGFDMHFTKPVAPKRVGDFLASLD